MAADLFGLEQHTPRSSEIKKAAALVDLLSKKSATSREAMMFIVVETFLNPGEPSSSKIRVRAVAGQGIAADVRVQCSKGMREEFRLGQRFLLEVNWCKPDAAKDFLTANFRDKPHPLSDAEAQRHISENFRGSR